MKNNCKNWTILLVAGMLVSSMLNSCSNPPAEAATQGENDHLYPSDVLPFMDKWKILLGDGTSTDDLVNYEKKDFFYAANDGKTDWVVYKTPNSGVTSRTSSNTRTELGQKEHWVPKNGRQINRYLEGHACIHFRGRKSSRFLFSGRRTDSQW